MNTELKEHSNEDKGSASAAHPYRPCLLQDFRIAVARAHLWDEQGNSY
jgi:hypothetical protein